MVNQPATISIDHGNCFLIGYLYKVRHYQIWISIQHDLNKKYFKLERDLGIIKAIYRKQSFQENDVLSDFSLG